MWSCTFFVLCCKEKKTNFLSTYAETTVQQSVFLSQENVKNNPLNKHFFFFDKTKRKLLQSVARTEHSIHPLINEK